MSFDHYRPLLTIPRRSSSTRRYRYPEHRDCEFDGYYDHESKIYDWVSKTSLERANLNRPRTQSVPQSRLQDPDYQCKRDLGWNIDYAFLVDRLEKADSPNSRMAADILSRARAVSHGMKDPYALSIPKRGIAYQAYNTLDEAVCRQTQGRCIS